MVRVLEEVWSTNDLPYFAGFQKEPVSKQFPQTKPFSLGFGTSNALLAQIYSPEIERLNNLAYKSGGCLSTPLGEGTFGGIIADDIIGTMFDTWGRPVNGLRVLEIGCSTGYLLNKLSKMGAIVVGCDPAPQSDIVSRKHLIVKEMFEADLFTEPFDLVYSSYVLEHMVSPESFVNDIMKVLKPQGLAFFCTNNCSRDIELGNPNMLLHEHWTYSTPEALDLLLQSGNYVNIGSKPAVYGGGMYMWGYKPDQKGNSCTLSGTENVGVYLREKAMAYAVKLDANLMKLQVRAKRTFSSGKTVGLYGASNAINLIGLLDWAVQPRLFDTDTLKHGLYIPCGVNPIESPDALIKNPVNQLWVLPLASYREIITYLKNEIKIPESIEVFSLYDIISSGGKG